MSTGKGAAGGGRNRVKSTSTGKSAAAKAKTMYIDAYKDYAKMQNKNLANQISAVNKQYANQQTSLANQLVTSKSGTNQNYDSNAAQAYINYAKQQNALPEQLRAQGINGGASESAMARIGNNYALNQSSNEAARAAAIAQLQNTYDTNLATMQQNQAAEIAQLRQANAADLAQQYLTARQNQMTYNDTLNQRRLEQYQATMGRFTSVKAVDKAIAKLKKSDPNYAAKKWLLQLRKAEIKAEEKKGSGGGSGRGYSGYSGGYSGGGSGSTDSGSTTSTPNVTANVAAAQTKGQSMTDYYKKLAAKANNKGGKVWGNNWSR